jgi:Ni/Fe-hydrogenase b-type cytochrome subunit
MKIKHALWSTLLAVAPLLANDFHPGFPLLDQQGSRVVDSGKPLSTLKTCGRCHDTDFIQAHSDHADAGATQVGIEPGLHTWDAGPGYFGNWNPIDYQLTLAPDSMQIDRSAWLSSKGGRHVGGGPVAEWVEMDCLLCHGSISDNTARNEALASGEYDWANSAPLKTVDALERRDSGWFWNADLFNEQGGLDASILSIRKPRDENCAQCHGQVSNDLEQPLLLADDPARNGMTLRTGQIISPQKINASGLNIQGKKDLAHAFDVHSDRVMDCVSCHYSLNNPVYFQRQDDNQPEHLIFDPRRLTSADYLQRPSHQFAKGNTSHGLASAVSENSLRRCESCHEAENVHQWLPYKTRHFAALACESCHIPKLYGPVLQTVDWSVLDQQGQPLRQYRHGPGEPDQSSVMLTAFEPILLARNNVGGSRKLAPFNLVSSWYWITEEPARPVSKAQLKQALFNNGEPGNGYRDALILVFDANQDRQLDAEELKLDSAVKLEAVKTALQDSGLGQISLQGEVSAFAISHNVVNGQWATRDCQSCHHENSRVDGVIALSAYQPGDVSPIFNQDPSLEFAGSMAVDDEGGVVFRADASRAGFHIIGRDGLALVDWLGMLMFFGVALGVSVHAGARYFANRKLGAVEHPRKREYLYDAYERLWHWLQASSILILLATGLIIHKPHLFGIFSFAYIIEVHNVVGFILLANAALALFYNLASGEIRQYLPEPKGFVGRSVAQAMYYTRGIFKGEPHPIQKSYDNKLNPLQQVTYLGILNVLLPAQVITGVLIWGAQRWPDLAQLFGGLPVLAPVHTLVAWTFATFIVMHVYLTTTGHTPTAGIKAMIEGWDEIEREPGEDGDPQ